MSLSAADVIKLLGLTPHPEGGHFLERFRDPRKVDGARVASTAIYYLLARGERSHWHRVDAAEVWHFYGGDSLSLQIAENGCPTTHVLGMDLMAGQQPQIVVPTGAWQSAQSLGAWTLVGCTVAPGFEFAGFEMAPIDWAPS
jgi:predicted cupin superfamily sugar epimerase